MKGRLARLASARAGETPTEFFYGAIELAKQGCEIGHFEFDPDEPGGAAAGVLNLFRGIAPPKLDGRSVVQAWRLRGQLAGYDCVVATAGKIAFALALAFAAGGIRTPIVAIHCGLLNHPLNARRIWTTRRLLARLRNVLFGEAEKPPMLAAFGLPASAVAVHQFGVDTDFWSPEPAVPRRLVLAVGNDGRRDFATLLAAAPHIPAEIHIVTRLPLPAPLPPNVIHHAGSWHAPEISDAELRALYRQARCVVVPLIPTEQPSGQSVTLQAMACGCPVVLTETDGLWTREYLHDGENIFFTPPRDRHALAAKIGMVLSDAACAEKLGAAARATALSAGRIGQFAAGIGEACAQAVRAV